MANTWSIGAAAKNLARPLVRPLGSTSLAYRAAQAHPNWAPPSSASLTINNPQPAPAGAPAAHPAAPAAPGSPAAAAYQPPDLSGNKWMAYLTPDQKAALDTLTSNTGANVAAQQRRMTDATAQNQQTQADLQYQQAQQTSAANQNAAARGMFLSSIRDNDLTDINRTYAERSQTANANLTSLIADASAAITTLNNNLGIATLGYQGDAAAQVPAPVAPPAPPAAASPAHPAAPGTPGPNAAPGAPQNQPTSSHPQPTRPGARTPSLAYQAKQAHPNW